MNVFVKARALFMDSSFLPLPKLVENFPTGCGVVSCNDDDYGCGAFDSNASRSFAEDSALLRHHDWIIGVVQWNLWICNAEEPADLSGKSLFTHVRGVGRRFTVARNIWRVCDDTLVYGLCCSSGTGIHIRTFANRGLGELELMWCTIVDSHLWPSSVNTYNVPYIALVTLCSHPMGVSYGARRCLIKRYVSIVQLRSIYLYKEKYQRLNAT